MEILLKIQAFLSGSVLFQCAFTTKGSEKSALSIRNFFSSNALLKTRGLIMILHIRSDLKICFLNLCMRSDLQRICFTLVVSETHGV